MIRVFVADDHPIFRRGIVQLLSDMEDFQIAGEASDGHATLRALETTPVDVLILDLSLPLLSGTEVLRRVREKSPEVRVVVLSMYPEEQYAARLRREGASAYLSKHRPAEEVVEVVRRVMAGPVGEVAPAEQQPAAPHEQLSAREHQIFMRLIEGRPVTDIAAELHLTQSTVSSHVARIKTKLGVRTIAEIVSYAHREGLIH